MISFPKRLAQLLGSNEAWTNLSVIRVTHTTSNRNLQPLILADSNVRSVFGA